MKPRLLFIVNVDWFFVSHRLPIALEALQQGYDVHLACQVTNHQQTIENMGIRVHPIDLSRSGLSLWLEFKSIYQIFKIVKLVQPELVHLVTIKPVIYGGIVSRIAKIHGRVASVSGLGYVFVANNFTAKLIRPFISYLYKLSLNRDNTRVIFQNPDDLALLVTNGSVKKDQCVLIRGSGVDLTKFEVAAEPRGDFVVMLVARLLIDKGVYEFVQAAKILNNRSIKIRFVLVGEPDFGNPNSITLEQFQEWKSEGLVECLGFCADVSSMMSKANLIVLPSYREGLPKSLLEAAASGRAVVTTDVPGCRDAIENGVTGLLVPVKNAEALAHAIESLLVDEDKRHSMALAGRLLAEKEFDIVKVVDIHMKIYSSLRRDV